MVISKLFPMLNLDLQHFAEGGDGGTAAEGATGVSEADAELQRGVNELNPEGAETDNEGDLDAEFEKSIKGKYKDAFNKRTQAIVTDRVKNLKTENETLSGKIKASQEIIDELAYRYGIDVEDVGGLLKAVKNDMAYDEAKAFEQGITLEERLAEKKQAREKQKTETELITLRQKVKDHDEREAFIRMYRGWDSKTEEVKALYPSYDLRAEMANPEFVKLLNSGFSPQRAYESVHINDIVSQAMKYATDTSAKNLTNSLIANGKRPIENGNAAQSAAVTKIDVSNLSPKQMDEYIRRARRGEKVDFSN